MGSPSLQQGHLMGLQEWGFHQLSRRKQAVGKRRTGFFLVLDTGS